MLVLEPKIGEKITLRDTVSGAQTTVRTFRRNRGQFALAFDAPMSVKITMEPKRKKDSQDVKRKT